MRRNERRPWSLHARTVFGCTLRKRAALVTESVASAGRLIDVMTVGRDLPRWRIREVSGSLSDLTNLANRTNVTGSAGGSPPRDLDPPSPASQPGIVLEQAGRQRRVQGREVSRT